MVTKELYKLEKQGITKDGHTMFDQDIVRDLNGWRNHARDMRNKNSILLREIGGLKAFVEEVNNLLDKAGEYGAVDAQEIKHFRDKFVKCVEDVA